jgi:hypothetical protein
VIELAEMLASHLSERYPKIYRVQRNGDTIDEAKVLPFGTTFDFRKHDPLEVIALLRV